MSKLTFLIMKIIIHIFEFWVSLLQKAQHFSVAKTNNFMLYRKIITFII